MESERREWAAERAELEEIRKGAAGKATREASEAAAKEAIDGRNESALQQPRVQVQQAEQGYRNHTGMSLFMSQNDKRVPKFIDCLLYTSPSPRDLSTSRMPSSA